MIEPKFSSFMHVLSYIAILCIKYFCTEIFAFIDFSQEYQVYFLYKYDVKLYFCSLSLETTEKFNKTDF